MSYEKLISPSSYSISMPSFSLFSLKASEKMFLSCMRFSNSIFFSFTSTASSPSWPFFTTVLCLTKVKACTNYWVARCISCAYSSSSSSTISSSSTMRSRSCMMPSSSSMFTSPSEIYTEFKVKQFRQSACTYHLSMYTMEVHPLLALEIGCLPLGEEMLLGARYYRRSHRVWLAKYLLVLELWWESPGDFNPTLLAKPQRLSYFLQAFQWVGPVEYLLVKFRFSLLCYVWLMMMEFWLFGVEGERLSSDTCIAVPCVSGWVPRTLRNVLWVPELIYHNDHLVLL